MVCTLSIALLTRSLVISPFRDRFSINASFEEPELRHAMVRSLRDGLRGALPGRNLLAVGRRKRKSRPIVAAIWEETTCGGCGVITGWIEVYYVTAR